MTAFILPEAAAVQMPESRTIRDQRTKAPIFSRLRLGDSAVSLRIVAKHRAQRHNVLGAWD